MLTTIVCAFALGLSLLGIMPVVLGLVWTLWDSVLRPRLIPQAEIDRLASVLIARSDDPEQAAFIEHHAAWFRAHGYEEGKWRRIRRAIRRQCAD